MKHQTFSPNVFSKRANLSFLLLLLLLTISCSFSIAAQNLSVDLAIVNAKIHKMDEAKPIAEAVAVKGEKIVAVGSNKEIRELMGANTKVIDASGKLVLPGFNDAHVHFWKAVSG